MGSPELLRECGRRLTNRGLWAKFQERFQSRIFLYLLREIRSRNLPEGVKDIVSDLAQDVYVRLVQHDGRILRSFRGSTEFSAMAFLARVSVSVVSDYQRREAAIKRSVPVISLEEARKAMDEILQPGEAAFEADALASMLSWIDVDKVLQADSDQRNARRNLLIFKLHYMDGFTATEISKFPGFGLTKSGVDTILARLRKRLRNEK
jgi:RNA polymerase sigma-70 factor (ECF subfamily)